MSVDRRHLIDRIKALSDEDFERVGPHLEAEIDALDEPEVDEGDLDIEDMNAAIERGLESARTEPLLTTEEVMRRVGEVLRSRRQP
jgi:hypothetical protein